MVERLASEEEYWRYQEVPESANSHYADTLLEPLEKLGLSNSGLLFAEEAESVAEVAARMGERRVGCALVVSNGKVSGICSDRDIIQKVISTGADPTAVRVEEIMTADPECLRPDDTVAFTLHMMEVGGYRHVPLINDEYEPVGIVSVENIVEHIVEHFPEEVYDHPPRP